MATCVAAATRVASSVASDVAASVASSVDCFILLLVGLGGFEPPSFGL